MIIFGPAKITRNSTDLGDTYGGGTLNLKTKYRHPVGTAYTVEQVAYGGEGELNFYSWNDISINKSVELYDYAELKIETSTATVTLPRCKILLSNSFTIGVNEQQAIKTFLYFTASNNILLSITGVTGQLMTIGGQTATLGGEDIYL